jgi:hypothetical protein
MIEPMMNYLNPIMEWYDTLHVFFQNLVAAAAVGVISLVIRWVISKSKKSGSEFLTQYQKMDLLKHMVHKKLVSSENTILLAHGYFLITLEAFRWIIRGLLFFIFILCVRSFVNNDWWLLIGLWVLLNCFVEAHTWLKNKSSEKEISYINKEIKEDFFKEFFPKEVSSVVVPNQEINADGK